MRTAFAPGTVLDPLNEAFTIRLSNASGLIYSASLLPGDLKRTGSFHRFKDAGAKRGQGIRGGLGLVELRDLPKVQGGVRVTVWAYGDLTTATVEEMTVEITAGDDAIATTAVWIQRRYGWQNPHR
ncbi:MAG TPA: hypothetical protein VFD92_13870 [Candidatus Binatia bacterium]|nr:hypothetical protein [Candidatus Binatia bacterium]